MESVLSSNPNTQATTYRVQLPQFEGPFDLLLFFIERDEIDIHDIPIAKVTRDFMDYMDTMQALNIELAAEFIFVASTLMRIKAKMLLPRPVLNEAGEEIDPREELVKRLLEYKRYKAVISDLSHMEKVQQEVIQRGAVKAEEKILLESEYPEEELLGLDLYGIMRTFKRVWERHNEQLAQPKHVIKKYPYTLEQLRNTVLARVTEQKRVDFISLILEEREKVYVVFCFLAILELAQLQHICITMGQGYNNFWLEPKAENVAQL